MNVSRRSPIGALLTGGLLCVSFFLGCSGGGESPSGPQLGAEVDLSLYEPENMEDYSVRYAHTQGSNTTEYGVRFCGIEPLYDTDPDTGDEILVDCYVFEQDPVNGQQPRYRLYRSDDYLYGTMTWNGVDWDALTLYQPKRPLQPEGNPRINQVFDSGPSTLATWFVMFDIQYRQEQTVHVWTTYKGIEDSVTVPAGTFENALKLEVRSRIRTLQYPVNDPDDVLSDQTFDVVSNLWMAAGVGLIRQVDRVAAVTTENVLVSGTIGGKKYPQQLLP